jgi:cytochrome P450
MEFNPFSYEMHEDPYPTYRWLREHAPCYHNEEIGFWALSRFQDCWDATLDWQTYSSSAGPSMELSNEGEDFSIIGMDPPRHTYMRNLVSRGFTPRRIRAMEPRMRQLAVSFLARAEGAGECDIQDVLGAKLPMAVICDLVGIPGPMHDTVREWSNLFLYREADKPEPPPIALEARANLFAYLGELLAERKRTPRDDLMSLLIGAEVNVDGETKRLTDPEIVSFINLLAAAGNETTTKLIGNSIVLLAQHPEQRALLAREPARIPRAVEEILRYEAPSQYQGRIALRDATVHGRTIPRHARVILITGAACRDEREYPDPDRLDVTRQFERELYFGYGHHVCLGKSLARMESRIALEEVLRRWPNYELVPGGLERTHQAHVRGFSAVRIKY